MTQRNCLPHKPPKTSLKVRGFILIVQVLLPFGLYFALRCESTPAAVLIAALYVLSMIFLVWPG